MLRILHVSDLHFGTPSVPEQVEALERFIEREPLDAIVISGDLSQRTRRHEFERAGRFVRLCEGKAPTLVVPGTLDCWFDFNRNGSWSDPGEYFRFSQLPAEIGRAHV